MRRYVEMTDMSTLQADSMAFSQAFAEPVWLAENLNDPRVRLIEMDVSRSAYDKGHIPGAILWNIYADLRHGDYSLLDRHEFAELLGRSGLTREDTLVFYGYGSYLGFWLMKAYGHERVLMLRETRQDWQERGRPWTLEVHKPVSSTYQLLPGEPALLVTEVELQAALHTSKLLILDVRSASEFTGERFWPSGATEGAGRPGHIPGAVHLHVDLLRRSDGSFKPAAELRDLIRDHGVAPESSVVTYCTIGNRASEAAFVFKYLLGYPDVRVYYGSWAQWGSQAETPIEV
jgi:thiosulfate/3-mercaptopyruvate sulfurtransferase